MSRQRGLTTPAGRTQGAGRTRGGTAAAAARLAGRRGAEAEGARGEGQPGFDSRRGLTAIPITIARKITSRHALLQALLVAEAGLHALPRIVARLLYFPLPRAFPISISGRVVFGVTRSECLLRPISGCFHIT